MENIKGNEMGEEIFADIIIDISHEALDKVFQYRVPLSLRDAVTPGVRVCVPFGAGNREKEGYVIALKKEPDYDVNKIKEITRVAEGSLTVESQLIQVAAFLKRRYGSSMIQALKTVMPVKSRVRHRQETNIYLAITKEEAETLLAEWERKHRTARARFLGRLLVTGQMSKDEAVKECRFPLKELRKLAEDGVIRMETKVMYRDPFPQFEKKETFVQLNEEQQAAAERFRRDFQEGVYPTYLLFGVTGSGKTEVYLHMIGTVLAQGKQAIVLIPEISLTYQTVRRFYERFGGRIAVLHSRMSAGERSDACEKIAAGEADE